MGSDSHPRIPAAHAAGPKKGWLPLPFTGLPAMFVMIKVILRRETSISIFRYSGQPSVLYAPFGASLETGVKVFPEKA